MCQTIEHRTQKAVQRLREHGYAEDVALATDGVAWLETMADETSAILVRDGCLAPAHRDNRQSSVEEMVADMPHNDIDVDNLSIEDLGMCASPGKALRLMTIHEAKGREFAAVAIIGVREGLMPHYRSTQGEALEAEKRQSTWRSPGRSNY
jgi:DNA helicase-2/ATP-dependent DNA helicase PcrA